ncbi:MAG: hypothetical protein E6177_06890, partial [Clostridium sp.]|nr:hypothetical protein [Clostridium sp.]
CEEFSDLPLDDGTKKIFLNMTSKNGRPELISLLQYMKNTTIDNPEVKIKDKRIITLDKIVNEVKQSEEWEAVKMNILEIGIEKGREEGRKDGLQDGLKIGRAEGEAKLVSMIRRKLKKGLNATAISEALELEDAYVQKAVDLITEDSSKSDLDIAKMLLNQ